MIGSHRKVLIIAILSQVLMATAAEAQIRVDNTSNSRITRRRIKSRDIHKTRDTHKTLDIHNIRDGVSVNGNLFHSFEQFSPGKNQVARFVIGPQQTVKTIFARVTG